MTKKEIDILKVKFGENLQKIRVSKKIFTASIVL